jgi:hypothetical protein
MQISKKFKQSSISTTTFQKSMLRGWEKVIFLKEIHNPYQKATLEGL